MVEVAARFAADQTVDLVEVVAVGRRDAAVVEVSYYKHSVVLAVVPPVVIILVAFEVVVDS